MTSPLYLTGDEEAMFAALTDALKEGWTVEREMNEAYETDEQLSMRYHMASFPKYAAVKEVTAAVLTAKSLESVSLEGIPEEVLPDFFFTIGARGVSRFMDAVLRNVKTDGDVDLLANLSDIRHQLLETNSSHSS